MSSPRPLAFALGLAGALAGISVYLASTAAAGEGEVAATSADRAESASTDEYAEPYESGGEYDVLVRTERRGDVVTTAPGAWNTTVRVGRRSFPATAELMAGSGADGGEWSGRQLVRIHFGDRETSVLRVLDGGRGLPTSVDMTPDAEIRGRVIDPNGRGIEGVSVTIGDFDADTERTTTTDPDGQYVLRSRFGGVGVPVVWRAPGFAPTFRIVDLGVRFVSQDLQLEPSRTLEVQLAARVERPESGVVYVLPDSRDDSLLHYPFFACEGTPLDSSGAAKISDLPLRGEVRVVVEHPELEAPRIRCTDLAKDVGRALVLPAAVPERLATGVIVDPSGSPIEGARVSVEVRVGGSIDARPLLPAVAYRVTAVRAETDGAGAYRLARPERACLLTVRAPGHVGVRIPVRAHAEWPARIELPAESTADGTPMLRLRFPPEGRSGRLRADDGVWRAWSDDRPAEVVLDEPGLLDVTVLVMHRGRTVLERRFESRAIAGEFELDLRD
ncbi:MAG: carboxypeptidase regulatory-like domain-containing protein [Planctomycetes bacterium]|nr:carboxypeptidase regulatory-like domain-containing protein [Planctomycetota bacterium]